MGVYKIISSNLIELQMFSKHRDAFAKKHISLDETPCSKHRSGIILPFTIRRCLLLKSTNFILVQIIRVVITIVVHARQGPPV